MDDNKDALLQPDQTEDKGSEDKKEPSDNLTPEHPRFKQVIEQNHTLKGEVEGLKTELQSLKESIDTRQEATGDDDLTAEEVASLEKIDKQLRKRGYVTQEIIEKDRRIDKRAQQFERLSEKFDGKNGYPKFKADEVATHAVKMGTEDMNVAYRDLHFDAIVDVEAKKRLRAPDPTRSEEPTSTEREVSGNLTPAKIAAMDDQDWAENEDKIMRDFRKQVTGK